MIDIDLTADPDLHNRFIDALSSAFTGVSDVGGFYFRYFPGRMGAIALADNKNRAVETAVMDAVAQHYLLELLAAGLVHASANPNLLCLGKTVPFHRPTVETRDAARYRRLTAFLQRAYKQNAVSAIKRLCDNVLLEEDTSLTADTGFEKIFLPGNFADPIAWERRKSEIQRRVCRVVNWQEGNAPRPIGTGFLIGKDLVLTNDHNVFDPRTSSLLPGFPVAYACEFDYHSGGAESSTLVRLCASDAAGREPLVAHSPATGGQDWALLRLASAVGEQRGWEDLAQAVTPRAQEVVVIFQHPAGQELRFAAGPVSASDGDRVTYLTNTLPGSSGSPCYTFDLRLVALHHLGGPKANEGIRLEAILPNLPPVG